MVKISICTLVWLFATGLFFSASAQAPTVSSITPNPASPGTSVTITGSNFNTTPANNIVYFGATKATVTAAGSTSLTATVPVGATYAPVTVNNVANNLIGAFASRFLPNYNNSTFINSVPRFDARTIYAGSSLGYGIAAGDIDGDGKPDVVVCNISSSSISVYRNTASTGSFTASTFATRVDFSVGSGPNGVAITDVDADGKLDVVVSNYTSNTVSVLRNTATSGVINSSSLAAKVDFTTGTGAEGIQITDLDLDGKPDIIVPNYTAGSISVLRNTTTSGVINSSSFAAKVDFAVGSQPERMVTGDIDGDGRPEMLVTNSGGNTISLFRNISSPGTLNTSSFATRLDLVTGTQPVGAEIADVDGDGKADIVVACNTSGFVSVFRNISSLGTITSGSFAARVDITTISNPGALRMGDANGDGKPDIFVTGGSNAAVILNNTTLGSVASGSFVSTTISSPGDTPNDIAVVDIDGDSRPDLLSPNSSSNGFSALRNNPIPVPPSISSVSPNPANPGTSVTITGSNFNTTPASNIVYFGATKATVTAAGSTSLTATVPSGATFGPVSVNNTASALTGYSQYPFLPTYDNSGLLNTVLNFDTKVDFITGTQPIRPITGDVDGDGKPDLIVVNLGSNTVSVFRNVSSSGVISASSFSSKVDFATGSTPRSVAFRDVDGDGKPDIITANGSANTISVLRNTSTSGSITSGSFASKIDFSTTGNPEYVSIDDLDGDGKPEIVTVTSGNMSVFKNVSVSGSINSSSFASAVNFPAGTNSRSAIIMDFDGDGKKDVAIVTPASNIVSVYRNTSTVGTINSGSFAAKVDFTTGSNPLFVIAGDIDGDGKHDLIVANQTSNTISVLRNTPTLGAITSGSFAAKVDFATATGPYDIAAADFNGDGKLDIAVSCESGSDLISVFRNTATSGVITSGSFATKIDLFPGLDPSVGVGDVDGDGKAEIISANYSSNNISVFRNNPLLPPPTITSLSTSIANPGTSVTITGSNFNTTPANNIVYFGATKATVTAAGSTSLTATVPLGATCMPVSVNNTSSALTGYSQYPFLPTYDNSGFILNLVNFSPKVDFTTGSSPNSVAIGDMDGDGKSDLVTVNASSNTISVFRNTSATGSVNSSSFTSKVDFTTSTNPSGIVLGDVDGDGKLDIVVNNAVTVGNVSVLRNTSTSGIINSSSFATIVNFSVGNGPYNVALGDLDGDGKPDLVATNSGSNNISVLRNLSIPGSITSASFAMKVDFNTGNNPRGLALSDVDGDNKIDIIISNTGDNTVSIFRNLSLIGSISASSFATRVNYNTGTSPQYVIASDIDGDAKTDITVANSASSTISVFRNISTVGVITTGSLAAKVDFTTGSSPYWITVSDFDGDSKIDIATANYSANSISILRNTATMGSITASSLSSKIDFATATGPLSLAGGDIDGDYKADIAVVNQGSNSVSILKNSPSFLPPTVTSVSPNPANPGTSVTITGTNFNTTPANNIVYFGATKATVTSAGSTSLTATVPTGATFMPVSVLNTTTSSTGYSQYPFLPTYDNSGYIPGIVNFSPKVDFTTGSGPYRVILGDIDGDGKSDMVVVNRSSGTGGNSISIYRNTSSTGTVNSSSFAAKVDFSTATQPGGVALGDIDGDGKLDIAVTSSATNVLSVFRNVATSGVINSSSLAARVDFATNGITGYGVIITDLDRDGKSDIAMVNQLSNTFSIFRNTSIVGVVNSSSLSSPVDFTTGANPADIMSGDFDGDGKADIATTNYNASGSISVFRNTSVAGIINSASFATKVDFTVNAGPNKIAVVDIDGDGKQDIVVGNAGVSVGINNFSVLRNTSTLGSITSGSFAAKVDFTTGVSPYVAIADIDGDSKPDIVTAHQSSNFISVFRNIAISGAITSGSFATRTDFPITGNCYDLAAGDLDGDGKPEVAICNNSSNTVSVFLNAPLVAPPSVSSLSPNPANPGTSVTITGNNFNTTPANNIVYFGATKATVTAAGSTSLTATVPSGATFMPVSVLNTTTSSTGYSQHPFLPTYNNTGFVSGTVNFSPKADFTSGINPNEVKVGDIDGDGKTDIVVCNYNSTSISVFRNTSTSGSLSSSSFAAKVDFVTGTQPRGLALGDIDGDGKIDIAVVNFASNTVSVFRNTASGGTINASSFAAKVDFATGSGPFSVTIDDFDKDGKADIAVVNSSSNTISVYRNTGTPGITSSSFASRVDFSCGTDPRYITTGDIDGDGKPEMVVANNTSNSVMVFRNTATSGVINSSSFATAVAFSTASGSYDVALADIDGDGKLDMIATTRGTPGLSIFRNTATTGTINTGSFSARTDFPVPDPSGVDVGDFNGDGKPDLAVSTFDASFVSVFRNTATSGTISSSSLAAYTSYSIGNNASSVAVSDFDGDGMPDITVANYNSSGISVFRNNPLSLPPTVTSVSPNPANPGTSVTITGSNFNTTPANNIVYFGATKATVTAAGSTSLTATVPTGATFMPVSVNNTATALAGYSQHPFLPVFDNSNHLNSVPNFDPKVDFATGSTPFGVAIGDLDGDGKTDIVAANYNSNTVSVYRNTSTSGAVTSSSFATKVDFATTSGTYAVSIADVNGDGKLDIIASNATANSVSVLQNTASAGTINTSSFAAKVDFSTGSSPYSIAMVDMDSDGKPEIVTANYSSNSISLLRNTCGTTVSSTSFAAKVDFAAGSFPISIVSADFDGDNKPDVVVANYNSNSVSVFRNTSTIGIINSTSLAAKVDFATGTNPFALAAGDLNGDGKLDIAVTNYGLYTLSLIRNTATSGTISSGSFAAKVDFNTSAGPDGLAIADMNGDGKADVVVSNLTAGSLSVFRNTTTSGAFTSGSLASRSDFTTGSTPEYVALGDLDGDSKPDIVVSNNASNSISVIRNSPLLLPPTITSVSPNPANPGTSVTITGTNFNTTPANNIVYFGATKATVTAAGSTSLTATVPVGATFAPVSVLNTGISVSGYSQYPFLPTYDNGGYVSGVVNFDPKVDFTYTDGHFDLINCDIDGDGKADLITCNSNSGTVSVYRNLSSTGSLASGSLASVVNFSVGTNPSNIAVGDIDGDGKPDIVATNYTSNTTSVLRNISVSGTINSGSFAAKVDFVTANEPRGVVLHDVDRDGKPDVIIANATSNSVSIFRNVTNIGAINSSSFEARVDFAVGTAPFRVVFQDLDGDGKAEMIVTNSGSNTISVLRNISLPGHISATSFATKVDFSTGTTPFDVVLSDLDIDGKQEVIVSNIGSNNISVLRNTASAGSITTSSFATKVDFPTGATPRAIAVGDLDGDGKPDVISSNSGSANLSLLRNISTVGTIDAGTFAARVDYSIGGVPRKLTIGDVDGDGRPDLTTVNQNATVAISLLRNNPLSPIIGTTSVCVGAITTLTNPTTGGTWSSSATGIATVGSTGVVTGVAAGTATISYTVAGGSATAVVTVNPLPNPGTITGASSVCAGSNTTLSNTISGGVWSSSATTIATVGSTGVITGISAGLVTISYTVSNACGSASAMRIVTVNQLPTPGIQTGSALVAVGATVSLSDVHLSVSGPATIASDLAFGAANYNDGTSTSWGGIPASFTNIPVKLAPSTDVVACSTIPGGYFSGKIALIYRGSCEFSYKALEAQSAGAVACVIINNVAGISDMGAGTYGSSVTIPVYMITLADGNKIAARLNAGDTVLMNMSYGGGGGTFSSLSPLVATVTTAGLVTGVDTGLATVHYTVTNGCGSQSSSTNMVVVSAAAIAGSASLCSGSNSTLTGTPVGGTWSSSVMSVATVGSTGIVNGVSPGTAVISYVYASSIATTVVTVNALPNAGTVTGTGIVCAGSNTLLSSTASGGVWSSSATGIATVGSTGVVTGVAAGTAVISYAVTNGCGSVSAATFVTVNPLPNLGTITGAAFLNAGSIVTLGNAVTGGIWSSSNTGVATVGSTSGTVSGIAAGTTTISYEISNSCGIQYATKILTVNPFGSLPCASWTEVGSGGISAGGVSDAAMAINNTGIPYIGYISSGVITVKRYTDTTWSTVGASGFSSGNCYSFSIAIDSGNQPFVTYMNVSDSGKMSAMRYNGSNWVYVGTPGFNSARSDIQLFSSLAIDKAGTPYVSFCDQANGNKITVMKFNGTSWITVGAAGFSASSVSYTSIAIDTTGIPYVAYADNSIGGKATVKKYLGGSWTTVGTPGFSGVFVQYTTIALDASGTPYVVYRESGSTSRARVMKFNGATWVALGTTAVSDGEVEETKISIDGNGTPYVLYKDYVNGYGATVKKFDGTDWITVGSAGISAGEVTSNSIALSNDGVPYISYRDNANSYKATCMVFAGDGVMSPITGAGAICMGTSLTLANATPSGTWSTSAPTVAIVGTSGIVTGVGAGTATISYIVTGGCAATKIVTVNPLPNSGTITGSTSVCVGDNITLSNTTSGGSWSSSNTSVATIGSTGLVNGVASGTTTISYSVTNGCGSVSATKVITVNTTPSVGTISGASLVCAGSTIILVTPTTGGSWTSSASSIATVNSSGIVTGIALGTAVVSYTVSNECGNASALRIVSVNPLPVAGTITGSSFVNAGATITLSNATTGGTWSSSNSDVASVNSSGVVNGMAAGTTTISYSVSNSCGSVAATKIVTVNAVLETSITGTLTVCQGSTTTLSNATSGGSWSSSNTAVATIGSTGIVAGISAGTSVVSYTISGTSVTAIVTVNPLPNAGTITGSSTVCTGTTLILFNSTTGGSWSSSSDGATVGSTGVVTGVAAGSAIISYSVSNECGTSVATKDITILSTPDAGTITGTASLCVEATTTLSNTTTGGTWSSGYPAVATVDASGLVTGVGAGSASISYRMTNFCGTAYATRIVTINPLPNAGTIAGANEVCVGATTTMPFISVTGVWSSSDPSIATINASRVVTGIAAGVVTISHTVTNSCGTATATKVMTVNPLPVAGSLSGASVICAGTTTTITPSVTGGTWSSSNPTVASVSASGEVTCLTAGVTTISYRVTNSCGIASATHALTVSPAVAVGTIGGSSSVCVGTTITLTNTTSGGTWSSTNTGAATVSSTGVVAGVAAGATTISYVVANSCGTAIATKAITVNPLPISGTISGPSSMCVGTNITLTSTGTGGSWISGATSVATISSVGEVTGIAAGAVIMTYSVVNGCGVANATYSLTVTALPAVAAISGSSLVCAGSNTTLFNSTSGGTWSSTANSVAAISSTGVVSGVAAGTATISYVITGGCGSIAATRVVTVLPLPVAGTVSGTNSLCVGATSVFSSTESGGTWSSNYPAGASVNSSTGLVTGVAVGSFIISYTMTNSCGTMHATRTVTVSPVPNAGTIGGANQVCVGATTTMPFITASGVWNSSNPSVATINSSRVVTGIALGTVTISHTVTTGCGTDVATKIMTVNPLPVAGSLSGSSVICVGNTATITPSVSGGTWSSNNATKASVNASGVVTGLASGNAIISYRVTNSCGIATATHAVTVNPAVTVAAIGGSSSLCAGSTITLTNTTTGGTWSSTNTSVATIGTTGIVTGVAQGNTTISYVVSNSCGTTVATRTLTVNPLPTAGTISGASVMCISTTTTLSTTGTGGSWISGSVGVATINSSGLVSAVAAGVAPITYRVINGCGTANAIHFVTISALPAIGASISGSPLACVGGTSEYSNPTGGGGGVWSSNNTTVATISSSTGILTGVSAGVVTISYVKTNGCGSSIATLVVTVLPLPVAGTISGTSPICSGTTSVFSSTEPGGTWNSNYPAGATVSTAGVVTGVANGNFIISYRMTNSCGTAYASFPITVISVPALSAISGSATVCVAANTTLGNTISGGTWSSSNTAVATIATPAVGVVTGVATGTSTISYTASNTCGTSVVSRVVTVNSCARPGVTVGTDRNNSVFTVSPNPTTGAINLTTDVAGKVVIYTIDGKELEQYEAKAGTTSISLPAGIASGVYMLRFNGADGSSRMVRLIYQQ